MSQQQEQQQQTAIVPVPPDPPVPLPDAIRDRVLQALSASGSSVPRIQRALAAELESDDGRVPGSASFGSQVYEMIVQQLRERRAAAAAGDDKPGQLTLRSASRGQAEADEEEAHIRSQVMAAVKAARQQDPDSQLQLTPEARKAMLQAVRQEVAAVCRVEEQEGVDTPFGKMF